MVSLRKVLTQQAFNNKYNSNCFSSLSSTMPIRSVHAASCLKSYLDFPNNHERSAHSNKFIRIREQVNLKIFLSENLAPIEGGNERRSCFYIYCLQEQLEVVYFSLFLSLAYIVITLYLIYTNQVISTHFIVVHIHKSNEVIKTQRIEFKSTASQQYSNTYKLK